MTDKRKVICIIAVLCVVFFSLLGIILVNNSGGGNTACIYSDGKLIKTISIGRFPIAQPPGIPTQAF